MWLPLNTIYERFMGSHMLNIIKIYEILLIANYYLS